MTCLTIKELNKLKPCPEDGRRARALLRKLNSDPEHCFTAVEAREAGCTFADIMWAAGVLARTDKTVERKLQMFAADCVARVLHIFERKYPNDDRPRKAIKARRDYANGRISANAAYADYAAARAAAFAAYADARADYATSYAARAAYATTPAAADYAAARAADYADAYAAAERQWQFDRLTAWLSDDEPRPLRLPAKPKVAA